MSGFPTVDGIRVLLPPPPEYIVDLANPQRNGDVGIYWCYAIGSALALLFLAQRLYTRVVFDGGLQLDDGETETYSTTLVNAWLTTGVDDSVFGFLLGSYHAAKAF